MVENENQKWACRRNGVASDSDGTVVRAMMKEVKVPAPSASPSGFARGFGKTGQALSQKTRQGRGHARLPEDRAVSEVRKLC